MENAVVNNEYDLYGIIENDSRNTLHAGPDMNIHKQIVSDMPEHAQDVKMVFGLALYEIMELINKAKPSNNKTVARTDVHKPEKVGFGTTNMSICVATKIGRQNTESVSREKVDNDSVGYVNIGKPKIGLDIQKQ